MKIIGLTGGIGSGKTTVAKYFEREGVPVYYADEAGRQVLSEPNVRERIVEAFGDQIAPSGQIDRKKLAAIVFTDPAALERLNAIVHPAVREDFKRWKERHAKFVFIIREAAILFESGSYKDCDAVILVTAPLEERIRRVVLRDQITREAVLARMANQWGDDQKAALSDFVIVNVDHAETERQCAEILKKLKNL